MDNGTFPTTFDLPVLPGILHQSHPTDDEHVRVQIRNLDSSDGTAYLVGFRVVRPNEDDTDESLIWRNLLITLNWAVAVAEAEKVRTDYNRSLDLETVLAAKALLSGDLDEVLHYGHNRPFPDEGFMLPFMDKVHAKAKSLLEDALHEVCDSWS